MDEIVIGEKKYISSKQAAKATGYAKDYIGQLCREGRVPARLVGRSWYVLESAIQDHRFGDPNNDEFVEPEKVVTTAETTIQSTWETPRYESSKTEILPSVNILQKKETTEENNTESDAAQRLQDTWQAWFDRFEHIAEAVEIKRPVEEKNEEPESQPEPEPEHKEDTVVPVHAVYEPEQQLPPEELLPRRVITTDAIDEDVKPKTKKKESTYFKRTVMAVQVFGVLIATISVITAVLGSGYLDSYILSNSQVRIIAGVALYNK